MTQHRILFNGWADDSNVNAQNITCKELARRIDARRFAVDIFTFHEPDPRLVERDNIRLVQIPARWGTPAILGHLLGSCDAVLYLRMSRADSIFRWIRRRVKGRTRLIAPVEFQMDRLDGVGSFYDEVDALADTVVANSPYVAETYRERYGREPHVILNGVDTALFRKLSSNHRLSTSGPRVMFTGSLQQRKHPEIALDAARLFPKVQFVILGEGPLRPLLERRVSEEKLHNVTLLTARDYECAARELVKADVFLFRSRAEGLPRVTLAAKAAEILVLAFNDYQTRSVLDGETGYCVDTVVEMMEKLEELIDDPSLRSTMGAAAVEHARRFDWSVIVPQWEGLFEEVLAAR